MKNKTFIVTILLKSINCLVIGIIAIFLFLPAVNVKANDFNNSINFNIDQDYDASARSKVLATLIKTTDNFYFYVETSWWNDQITAKKNEILANLSNLSTEFGNNIYPNLTSKFGFEPKPGVDGDNRITILFHTMREEVGGYFRSADGYFKIQVPNSNEREMLYLPVEQIDNVKLKVLLAHEFMHLITFNQKDKIRDVQEDVWLNEARADYTSTILGYDDNYEGSNLQRRARDFIEQPSNSLTEWKEIKYDYAITNIFMQYLADHYGVSILSDSLKSKSVGIESINEALFKNGFKENFSQIFTNWTITVVVNDCALSLKYCYLSNNLKNLKINPTLNFLPLSGDSSLSVTNFTKNWAGNWQKIIGGNGNLKLQFSSLLNLNLQVPYIIIDKNNNYSIKFLKLDKNGIGEIDIKNFSNQYSSLVIIPSLQNKISGFDGSELVNYYSLVISTREQNNQNEYPLIQELISRIDSLKKQIADILAQRQGENENQNNNSCAQINNSLYFGMANNVEVKCLQGFLKLQGQDIYPEGLITGNFGNLTKIAVIRFQEKYASEILIPIGLQKGTGFVGSFTKTKINQILKSS